MDKNFAKGFVLSILFILSIGLLVACGDKTVSYSLSETKASYTYADFGDDSILLPRVLDNKGAVVDNQRTAWSIKSGDTAYLSQDGHSLQLYNKKGETVFEVVVDKNPAYKYTFVASVDTRETDSLDSSLSGQNYAQKPGLAKKRVFGNKDIEAGAVTSHRETITLLPGVAADNEDYEVSVTDAIGRPSDLLVADFVGLNRLQLSFDDTKTGRATLKVTLQIANEIGEYPFFSYPFEIVDGINVSSAAQLQAVQSLVKYNVDDTSTTADDFVANRYTYNGYTGWDGTKFENIVLRDNIKNLNGVTLFYGSVYGNGYAMDATPYVDNNDRNNNHPNKQMTGDSTGENKAQDAFYLMSDNTVLDNIDLVGTTTSFGTLNDLVKKKGVLGVYGHRDTIDRAIEGSRNDSDGDGVNDLMRTPRNIKIVNSIIEKGARAVDISGAMDETAPIWIESSVLRYTGQQALSIKTFWAFEGVNEQQVLESKTFVTFKDNIIAETFNPPINMLNGTAGGRWETDFEDLSFNLGYGSTLTILGDKNYIFFWQKVSLMSFNISGVDVTEIMKDTLTQGSPNYVGDDYINRTTYVWDDGTSGGDILATHWYNLSVMFSARFVPITVAEQNKIDFSKSNLQNEWLSLEDSSVTTTVLGLTTQTGMIAGAPRFVDDAGKPLDKRPSPHDDLSVVVPQRIAEIVPAMV
ncbi:MAG: hypothetical protein FWD76_01720 [Firmicutes bacterium]|nr:hypothetical protein [Bacillota bacterium]